MDWLLKAPAIARGVAAKVWALLKALWGKARVGWNMVFDPPPAAIKWYILAVLAIAVGGAVIGSTVNEWRIAAKPVADPVYLIPRLPSVIVTVPPSASPKDLAPLKTIKASEAEAAPTVQAELGSAKTAPKRKRKPKKAACNAMFC